jgi:DNA-binding LacI/PurR family transcriptional regulator
MRSSGARTGAPPGSGTKVTSAEVAARAGVSQSAVSRVFTPGASASAKTIEKVRRAAEELGYRPNVLARAMVSGRSRIIGLVVAYLDNQFYPDVLERLSKALQVRGYHVLVFMASQEADRIDDVVEELLDYQVDGIIAASVALSSDLAARCRAAGVPMVLFNRAQEGRGFSSVTTDNAVGGARVAELFVAAGHKRIAYIAGWEGASTQRDREVGFTTALAAAGQFLHARGVGNYLMEEARNATREMFSGPPCARPDAVFVANDHMAVAVIDTLRHELGLAVPGDVSVAGYDDVPAAAWPSYDLTTVRQPADHMVAETVDLLLDLVEEPGTRPRKVEVAGRLILRGSTRLPQGWTRT